MSNAINFSEKIRSLTLFNGQGNKTMTKVTNTMALPIVGLLVFLLLWSASAKNIVTSLGEFPGPVSVWEQSGKLIGEHKAEREKGTAFYDRQKQRIAERQKDDPTYNPPIIPYTGKETFFDQIKTSLITVTSGFLLASAIAIPLGLLIGLSTSLNNAINPIIQILRPISPLAWLPLVTMIVSAVYVAPDPVVPKSFLTSMFTVMLCCLWPTVINTALGVTSVSKDLNNVSKVLRLGFFTHIYRIVLPSAIPMIFTGLRTSLGIAWMVLIAAEMLAQSPGLGKFVWDEFQNGSSDSLSRIMVAVITIGIIGFLLDRIMLTAQHFFSWQKTTDAR